nr:hypothetical protein [uncultured Desulfobacter sp.]
MDIFQPLHTMLQGNRIYIKKVIAIAIGIGIENNGHFDPDSEIDCEVKIAGKIVNAVTLYNAAGGGQYC